MKEEENKNFRKKVLELHGSMSHLHDLEILDMAKVRRRLRKETTDAVLH